VLLHLHVGPCFAPIFLLARASRSRGPQFSFIPRIEFFSSPPLRGSSREWPIKSFSLILRTRECWFCSISLWRGHRATHIWRSAFRAHESLIPAWFLEFGFLARESLILFYFVVATTPNSFLLALPDCLFPFIVQSSRVRIVSPS
jgi:hypothetical protein